jgi:hypothetical protein
LGKEVKLMKRVVVWLLVVAFLGSIAAPDAVLAQMFNGEDIGPPVEVIVAGALVVTVLVAVGIYYLVKPKSKPEQPEEQKPPPPGEEGRSSGLEELPLCLREGYSEGNIASLGKVVLVRW